MKFESLQVLDQIKALYELPRTKERFDKYLYLLQGDSKDEMILPIASFNPMGKELAMNKLQRLIELNAEDILAHEIKKINPTLNGNDNHIIRVAINLADDIEGAWSNYFTTDYKSKFEIESLLKINFCTPIFWTSEILNEELVTQRIKAYLFRTIFWVNNKKPETLKELFKQEVFVQFQLKNISTEWNENDFLEIQKLYQENIDSTDYNLKFNFFYGDEASQQLGYSCFGAKANEGFEYSKLKANHSN